MRKFLVTCVMALLAVSLWAQQGVVFKPTGRLVNDYSAILTEAQRDSLERRLGAFDDSTSNQIAVIFTPTLYGEEIKELGTRIAQDWGVGQKELDNGVMIIVKTKNQAEPDGDVAILPGEGLEGVLPDVVCAHIIDDAMLDHLIDGDYYEAVLGALDIIEPACLGEYHYDKSGAEDDDLEWWEAVIGFGFLALILYGIVRVVKSIIAFFVGLFGSGLSGGSGGYSSSGSSHSSSSSSRRSSSSSRRSSSSSRSGSSSSRSYGGGSFSGGGASRKF